MANLFQRLAIVLFFVALGAPWIYRVAPLPSFEALDENRVRQQPPHDLSRIVYEDGAFGRDFERYFNDHYPIRDLLIRVKNQIDYSVFGESELVVIGEDNWLFYRSVTEHEQIMTERAGDVGLEVLWNGFVALNRYYKTQGATLVLVLCPQKNTVYPELLPRHAAHRPTPTIFKKLMARLRAQSEIAFVDVDQILTQRREHTTVFHRTDFHWNDPAAFEVAERTTDLLARRINVEPVWRHQPVTKRLPYTRGGQNQALAILWPFEEPMLELAEFYHFSAGRFQDTPGGNWDYDADERSPADLLPVTTLFGNSFSDGMLRAGFTKYFVQMRRIHSNEFSTRYQEILPGSQFVIVQDIEAGLYRYMDPGFWSAFAF